jgi:hypothetical protein
LYGKFDFFQQFLRFFAKKSSLLSLKHGIFTAFFKTVGFPTLLSPPAKSYNKGSCFNVVSYISCFLGCMAVAKCPGRQLQQKLAKF